MRATLFLLGSLLVAGQTTNRTPPARGSDWLILTHLNRGQELVYRGTFTEESACGRVQFSRAARFESRLFVLDAPSRGAEVAFLTVFKPKEAQGGTAAPISVRLERATVDLQGKLTPVSGASPT